MALKPTQYCGTDGAGNRIRLVHGDTAPAIVCTLKDDVSDEPIGLTGATLKMYFKHEESGVLQAIVPGTIMDAPNGVCAFFPSDAPEMLQGKTGNYLGEIEVTHADSTVQTVYTTLKFRVRESF